MRLAVACLLMAVGCLLLAVLGPVQRLLATVTRWLALRMIDVGAWSGVMEKVILPPANTPTLRALPTLQEGFIQRPPRGPAS